MSHKISWYVEKRVIQVRLAGELAEDEFARVGDSLSDFASIGVPPVFLIVDVRQVSRMPTNVGHIAADLARFRGQTQHDWTIVLSNNTFFNFIGIVASKVVGVPMRIFRAQEEADAFIAHNAPELASVLVLLEPI